MMIMEMILENILQHHDLKTEVEKNNDVPKEFLFFSLQGKCPHPIRKSISGLTLLQ